MNNMNYNKIIVFSAPRTGSTVVYNLLKEIITNIPVIKSHETINFNENNTLYIIPIRHPYNSIVSISLCKELDLNKEFNLRNCFQTYMDYGGMKLININENTNTIFLYYEKFYTNLNYIFDEIERKSNFMFDVNKKTEIIEKHSINSVKNKVKIFKKFENYDEETQYHGKHISIYNGETNFKNILNKNQIRLLQNNTILNILLKKFHY